MDNLIPWLVFGIPVLLAAGIAIWFFAFHAGPDKEIARLEARAAQGDPAARAALERMRSLKGVVQGATGQDPERARILATGNPGRATIVDVRPLGLEVTSGPVKMHAVEVDLALEGGGQVTVRDAVSELHVGRLLKGATVPVRVDPTNPQRVVGLWDTL